MNKIFLFPIVGKLNRFLEETDETRIKNICHNDLFE